MANKSTEIFNKGVKMHTHHTAIVCHCLKSKVAMLSRERYLEMEYLKHHRQRKKVSYEPITVDASPSIALDREKKRGQDLPESVSSWMTGLKLCRKVFPQNSSNRAHSPRSSPSEEKHHIKCELQFGQVHYSNVHIW